MKLSAPYFFKRYWKDYSLGLLFLLLTNLLGASVPLQIKRVMDALSNHQHQQAMLTLVAISVILVLMFGVRILSRYFLIGIGRKIEYETRMAMFQHVLTMPRSFFDARQTGDLMSRMTNDLTALRMFLGGGMMLLGNVIFAYVTILPLMAMLSWRLTLFSFMLYPLVISLMKVLSAKVKGLSHWVQDRLGALTAVAQENFSGMTVIQSYAKETEESLRFRDASFGYYDANVALAKTRSLLYVLIALVSSLSLLVMLGEGGREAIHHTFTLSSFTAFMLYLERLSWPTVSFGWILSTFQQGAAAQERINDLLQTPSNITDHLANPDLETLQPGPIECRHLTFRYDNPYASSIDSPKAPALNDISFTVQPGDRVALVGPIGSGKSTLLNLLVRLYNAPEESIWIGGIPLERYPLKTLRQGMVLMPQNAFLFSTTVQQNLAYVNPEHHFENIAEMADIAQIHEEVMALPQSYETMVGERGINLSGGQRQRSTLARTLLAEPKILLLDDPFSNVDVETETAIIQALNERKLFHDKITIFASQRFSLVKQADWIIVLNAAGAIEATGTHQELLEQCALYRSLNRIHAESAVSG